MKRRWNLLLYLGFGLSLLSFVSYFAFFARFPVTRDTPWAAWLLFGVALVIVGIGLRRGSPIAIEVASAVQSWRR